MKLSTKSRYGLRILLQLAETSGSGDAIKGKELVAEQGITEPYMEQIMIKLKEAGYVRTERGCNGGYLLDMSPDRITILDIIELFEGPVEFVNCKEKGKQCERMPICRTSKTWKMLSDAFKREASAITLTGIIEMNKTNPEYVI